MSDLNPVSRPGQPLFDFFRYQNGAMLASGTAKCNGQVTLSLTHIMREQVNQQLRNAMNEFLRLRKGADVLGYARVSPGKWPELRDKMRVGKKANVKDEVGIFRHTGFVAKA